MTQTTSRYVVATRTECTSAGTIKITPIYYDQFYKLPFWVNVRMKLKRWIGL